METIDLSGILEPYNPWWDSQSDWRTNLPHYRRLIVGKVLDDMNQISQAISITGPRRVGKSTAVKHIIQNLLDVQGIDSNRILYFSFDDPAIFASEKLQHEIFDRLMARIPKSGPVHYYFLDEIQRLPRWELFVKKYYDLKAPVRFVISGSASSPIFRSSQESLLGRIKDHHLLPFSFREFCQYRLSEQSELAALLTDLPSLRPALLEGDGGQVAKRVGQMAAQLTPLDQWIDQIVIDYVRDGGFPEIWLLNDPIRKIEYLMEQQVRKVLYEDLMMLTQYRKPESILRFFVYLLSQPGVEINIKKIASEAGISERTVTDNLPRLEMTDLIVRIPKFSHLPLRVRQGNIKCYPIDLALRNAVLKNWQPPDAQMMGYYAENLVIRELLGWPEKIEISYYREKDREVDFIFTHGGNQHLPFEVKYRERSRQVSMLEYFQQKLKTKLGVVITRDKECRMEKHLYLPLRYFLLAT